MADQVGFAADVCDIGSVDRPLRFTFVVLARPPFVGYKVPVRRRRMFVGDG